MIVWIPYCNTVGIYTMLTTIHVQYVYIIIYHHYSITMVTSH